MDLHIKDRLLIPSIFPERGNFMDFNLKKSIARKIAISEQDRKDYEIVEKKEEKRIEWNVQKDAETPLVVEFSKEELDFLRQINHMLQGHPDMKHTPGVDMTTGSLGQGFSAACGMALAAKMDHADWRVYTILGDGELEEGQIWEAAMYAAHYKLDHLTAFIDNNGLQIDGAITDVMSSLPIDKKFSAFGWHVITVNGHNMAELHNAIEEARNIKGKPTMIIMKTVKGKGIPEIEGKASWHGKAPSSEECERFVKMLEAE